MGQYTEHWAKYKRDSNRRTLQLLGFLLFLPAIGGLGYLISKITDATIPVVVTLLVVWLAVFTRLALRSTKVACPRCSSTYSRGKYLVPCPQCGLRMFQEE